MAMISSNSPLKPLSRCQEQKLPPGARYVPAAMSTPT